MNRESKKEAIVAWHRERILQVAEKLFMEKGFEGTTIEDLSKASEYSRRTIYAYYEGKEDILHYMIEKGLGALKLEIEKSQKTHHDFLECYRSLCEAMYHYQKQCPYSIEKIQTASAAHFETEQLSETIQRILILGTEINQLLEKFFLQGQNEGVIRKDIIPSLSVQVWWGGIMTWFKLVQSKGVYLSKQFSLSEHELLVYGCKQQLIALLEQKIDLKGEGTHGDSTI